MANEIPTADKFFLTRFGMSDRAFERILDTALERKADYADLYFEYRDAEALSLEESMVNRTSKSVSHGVGVRVCAEDRTGYAYSDEVTIDRMKLAAEAARAIADQHGARSGVVQVGQPVARHQLYESSALRSTFRSKKKPGSSTRSIKSFAPTTRASRT